MDEEVDWGVEEDEFDPWTATTGSTQERGTGQPDSAKAVASQEPTGEEPVQVTKYEPKEPSSIEPDAQMAVLSSATVSLDERPLPPHWIVKTSRSNPDKSYFYNTKTKVTSWTRPVSNPDEEPGTPPSPKFAELPMNEDEPMQVDEPKAVASGQPQGEEDAKMEVEADVGADAADSEAKSASAVREKELPTGPQSSRKPGQAQKFPARGGAPRNGPPTGRAKPGGADTYRPLEGDTVARPRGPEPDRRPQGRTPGAGGFPDGPAARGPNARHQASTYRPGEGDSPVIPGSREIGRPRSAGERSRPLDPRRPDAPSGPNAARATYNDSPVGRQVRPREPPNGPRGQVSASRDDPTGPARWGNRTQAPASASNGANRSDDPTGPGRWGARGPRSAPYESQGRSPPLGPSQHHAGQPTEKRSLDGRNADAQDQTKRARMGEQRPGQGLNGSTRQVAPQGRDGPAPTMQQSSRPPQSLNGNNRGPDGPGQGWAKNKYQQAAPDLYTPGAEPEGPRPRSNAERRPPPDRRERGPEPAGRLQDRLSDQPVGSGPPIRPTSRGAAASSRKPGEVGDSYRPSSDDGPAPQQRQSLRDRLSSPPLRG